MIMSSDDCVYCTKICTPRQQSLQCDLCDRWQHRTCHTGITQDFYRLFVKNLEQLENWKCFLCSQSHVNIASAMIEEEDPMSTSPPTSPPMSMIEEDEPMSTSPPTSPPISPNTSIRLHFDDDGPSAEDTFEHHPLLDESHTEPTIDNVEIHNNPVTTYSVVDKGTQKGKPRLVNNLCFMYAMNSTCGSITWQSKYWVHNVSSGEALSPESVH